MNDFHIHSDHLGTPRAVSPPNGAVVWSWVSDAFGDTEPNEDPDGDGETFTLNLRHPGQYRDSETGFYYNHFRYYDPNGGRYITSDPIGLADGLNPFAYAGGNPLKYVDPLGLAKCEPKKKKCKIPKWARSWLRVGYLIWCLYTHYDSADGKAGPTSGPKPPRRPPQDRPSVTGPKDPSPKSPTPKDPKPKSPASGDP